MEKKHQDLYLFEKVKAGDRKSFELLFDKYYNNLCNFAYLFFKDAAHTEELVADVFVNIWEKRKSIHIKTDFKSYLYRSTRNAVINVIRKEKKNKLLKAEIIKHELSPETLMIRQEVVTHFEGMLSRLPKQAGLVFRLVRVDGLKYKEIAETLDISVKTVENHMGKALKMMRAMYEEKPAIFDE